MALRKYGVLHGTVVGHLRDADDDHYQILVKADGTLYRVAVNVKSAAKNAPSILLFQTITAIPASLKAALRALPTGYKKLPSRPGGLAQDFVRGGIVKPRSMTPVPPDAPGVDNDLKDKLEDATVTAMDRPGSLIYAFGERWRAFFLAFQSQTFDTDDRGHPRGGRKAPRTAPRRRTRR